MFNFHSNVVINGKWRSYLLINCNIELYIFEHHFGLANLVLCF